MPIHKKIGEIQSYKPHRYHQKHIVFVTFCCKWLHICDFFCNFVNKYKKYIETRKGLQPTLCIGRYRYMGLCGTTKRTESSVYQSVTEICTENEKISKKVENFYIGAVKSNGLLEKANYLTKKNVAKGCKK